MKLLYNVRSTIGASGQQQLLLLVLSPLCPGEFILVESGLLGVGRLHTPAASKRRLKTCLEPLNKSAFAV